MTKAVSRFLALCLMLSACADDGEPAGPDPMSPAFPVLGADGGAQLGTGGSVDAGTLLGSDAGAVTGATGGSTLGGAASGGGTAGGGTPGGGGIGRDAGGGAPGGGGSDAGAADAAASDAGNPFATQSVCTSNKSWTGGDRGSEQMHPGRGCIACHQAGAGFFNAEHGPAFKVAGTVFPTAHEPDECNGASSSGVSVVIKGANNQMLTLTPNAVGNFFTLDNIQPPYTAEVHYQGRVRAMATPQSTGDCNTCHTETGANGAPGRIMLP
jgi:hypothetical protein